MAKRHFCVVLFKARRTGTSICPQHTSTRTLLSDWEEYARRFENVRLLHDQNDFSYLFYIAHVFIILTLLAMTLAKYIQVYLALIVKFS